MKSNKTEVLSFDGWFGEASQNKLFWESPSKASKMGFDAGQESKQPEIEELQRKLDTEKSLRSMSEHLNNTKQAEVDELQKRIDRAVEHIEDYYGVVELSMVVDILTGDQS